jgi:hypothetical protein
MSSFASNISPLQEVAGLKPASLLIVAVVYLFRFRFGTEPTVFGEVEYGVDSFTASTGDVEYIEGSSEWLFFSA